MSYYKESSITLNEDNYLMNNSETKSKNLIDKKIKQSEHKRKFAKSFEFDRNKY